MRIKLVVVIIAFVIIIASIIAATGSLSSIISTTHYNNSNQGATTSSIIQEQIRTISYNELVQYALKKINEDRSKFDISAVKLSNDININNRTAAQSQAEDMLRTRQISHYTSNGMKPYMEYAIFGGKGYVAQNVGYDGFNNSQTNIINKCKIGVYICTPIDPIKSIDKLEHDMMYYDSIFNWSHRNNILDKHHTHVSVGIAYDKYSFVLVQNFENNYIEFDKPIIKINNQVYNRDTNNNDDNNSSKGNIEVSGKLLGNSNSIDSIHVYYDEKPTFLIYNQHKNDNLYDVGKLVAYIVKQLSPHHYHAVNQHYKQSSSTTYTLIQATKWWISSTALTLQRGESSLLQQQSIDIQFNISSLLNSEGVYTIVVYLRHNNNHDSFPVTSYSIFFFR